MNISRLQPQFYFHWGISSPSEYCVLFRKGEERSGLFELSTASNSLLTFMTATFWRHPAACFFSTKAQLLYIYYMWPRLKSQQKAGGATCHRRLTGQPSPPIIVRGKLWPLEGASWEKEPTHATELHSSIRHNIDNDDIWRHLDDLLVVFGTDSQDYKKKIKIREIRCRIFAIMMQSVKRTSKQRSSGECVVYYSK